MEIRKRGEDATTSFGLSQWSAYYLIFLQRWDAPEILPNLLEDIKKLVDSQSQIDPSFKSQRLYTRLSAAQVRHQLIEKLGYSNEELPTSETIRVKLNDLGYRLKRVAKIKPQKKSQKLTQSLSS